MTPKFRIVWEFNIFATNEIDLEKRITDDDWLIITNLIQIPRTVRDTSEFYSFSDYSSENEASIPKAATSILYSERLLFQ